MSITLSDIEIALQEDANNNKALIAKHKKEIQDLESNAEIALLKKKLNFLDKMFLINKQNTLLPPRNGTDLFLAQQALMKEAVSSHYFNETTNRQGLKNVYYSILGGSATEAIKILNPPQPAPYPRLLQTYQYGIDRIDEDSMRLEIRSKLDANQQKIDQLKLKVEMLEKQQFLVNMQIKSISAFERQIQQLNYSNNLISFPGNNPVTISHAHNDTQLPSSSNDNSIAGPIGMGIAGGATVSLALIAMVKLYDCYTKRKQQVAPLAPVVPIRQEVAQPEPEQEPADNGEGGDVLLAMLNAPDPIVEQEDNEPGGPEGMPHDAGRRNKCRIM